jgi:hypothetical protein
VQQRRTSRNRVSHTLLRGAAPRCSPRSTWETRPPQYSHNGWYIKRGLASIIAPEFIPLFPFGSLRVLQATLCLTASDELLPANPAEPWRTHCPERAQQRQRAGKRVSPAAELGTYCKKEAELHHSNQAAVALPNKLARISGAVLEARAAIRRRVPSDGSLSQRDNDNHGIAKGLPYRRSARQDSTNLMAERWVRRQGKAVNKRVPPENICSDWLPVRERSIMARSPQAPPERPDIRLQPYPSAIGTAPSQPGQSGRVHIRFVRDTAAECESLLDDVEDLSVPAYYQWDEFLIQSLPFF